MVTIGTMPSPLTRSRERLIEPENRSSTMIRPAAAARPAITPIAISFLRLGLIGSVGTEGRSTTLIRWPRASVSMRSPVAARDRLSAARLYCACRLS